MCLTTQDYGIICHKHLPTQFPITAVIQHKKKSLLSTDSVISHLDATRYKVTPR